ncbi:MAG: hypothetical protein HY023_13940 [Chloroflexi bacterium]|nr:hypothetical protein [Chloroflexota bacterium]MBI3761054.1 hypothetical protein [Chloroflexota bacterium]
MNKTRNPTKLQGSIRTPKFSSYKDEARFWDDLDTAAHMPDDDEWFRFEVTARSDRCEYCGSSMQTRSIDLHLVGHRVTLHRVPFLVCPTCHRNRLPETVEQLAREIEVSAAKALTPGPNVGEVMR